MYRPGRENGKPDTLSCNPVITQGEEEHETQVSQVSCYADISQLLEAPHPQEISVKLRGNIRLCSE